MEKPTFEVARAVVARAVTTINVDGRIYNAALAGPTNWHILRRADYGQGFRESTFGENLDLVHAAYSNKESPEAQSIIDKTRGLLIGGDTAIIYTPELIIVSDFPKVGGNRILMDENTLRARLGSHEVKKVIFSDDLKVRAIPYEFAAEWQDADEMRNNPFSIALTGDEEAPEKLAQIQEKIGKRGYVWALSKGTKDEIRVPSLSGYADRLYLSGDGWGVLDDCQVFAWGTSLVRAVRREHAQPVTFK